MKKIVTVLLVFLVLGLVVVDLAVPVILDKLIQKKASSYGISVTYDKIGFSLFTLDVEFFDLVVYQNENGKRGELFKADRLLCKKMDLFHGTEPRFVEFSFRGMVYYPINGYMAEFCSFIENGCSEVSVPLDGGFSLHYTPEKSLLAIKKVKISNKKTGTFLLSGELLGFTLKTWKKAEVEQFVLTFKGREQIELLLESELKKHKVTNRKELAEKLGSSVSFAVFSDNMACEFLGLTSLPQDEKKRFLIREKLLRMIENGSGISIALKKEPGKVPIKLGKVVGMPLRRYVKVMEYEIEIL